jgi:hypothetical protein
MFSMSGSPSLVPQKADPGNLSQASLFESWGVCVCVCVCVCVRELVIDVGREVIIESWGVCVCVLGCVCVCMFIQP